MAGRCGRCHGAQPPGVGLRPLHPLRAVAADRRRITAGDPDRARLFWSLLDGHDRPGGATETPPALLEPEDIAAARAWLRSLAPHGARIRRWQTGGLEIGANGTRYAIGDEIVVWARPAKACRLTLINVDVTGAATVIFPNAFAEDNALAADARLTVPAPGADYAFKARARGRERVIGLCASAPGPVLGIRHDYDQQRFTVLGDWETYLTRFKPAPDPAAQAATRAERRRARWRRRYYRRYGRRYRRARQQRQAERRLTPVDLRNARIEAVAVIDIVVR